MNLPRGEAVVAYRQMRGRGRQGRIWLDPTAEGVAMTLVVAPDRPERQAILAAIATCRGIEAAAPGLKLGIKWPNDVVIDGQKLAGILVEQFDDRALVGIGINVGQTDFDPSLKRTAVSLRQLGFDVDRTNVMSQVLIHFAQVLKMRIGDDEAIREFAARDVLLGSVVGFRSGDREVHGKVLRVDPMKGLAVLTETEGEVWLPSATTSVL